MINVAIVGATGYTGQELVRILSMHPEANIHSLLCRSHPGERYSEVFPAFSGLTDNVLLDESRLEEAAEQCHVLFLALPHGMSANRVTEAMLNKVRIIDLGSDFRLKNASLYDQWYQMQHPSPELLSKAVYGLTEWNRPQIRSARLVANPGCYATSVLLALLPLMKSGITMEQSLIVDAKSGVSGAGRAATLAVHFNEVNESIKAYKVGTHRHTPEIEQELSLLQDKPATVSFTPHLVPMNRGILSTAYVRLLPGVTSADLKHIYTRQYANEPFVHMLNTESPETRWVKGTNNCHISMTVDERTGNAIIISALDNLIKGASGQAVQNMNVMFGLPETTGFVSKPSRTHQTV